ncbi:hypothetical protein DPMN_139478 [Dreissena polymorpha]|uniref:Uncharacterized protein n=1 Tax=Dreissena polymorpha TaxID=45954 RepID=A0A9D4G5T3_DREPO|nr:hypothetical protein DPMN_139478 [Dreissena polymorpha]
MKLQIGWTFEMSKWCIRPVSRCKNSGNQACKRRRFVNARASDLDNYWMTKKVTLVLNSDNITLTEILLVYKME